MNGHAISGDYRFMSGDVVSTAFLLPREAIRRRILMSLLSIEWQFRLMDLNF